YLKSDAKSVELRKQYQAHVQKMFQLAGETPEKASAKAQQVMDFETALAKASLDRVSRREPAKVYHKMTKEELAALSPSFAWPKYFEGVGTPSIKALNVSVPEFFKQVEAMLKGTKLDNWKTYLSWQWIHSQAALLPSAFVNENHEFYGKAL